MLEEDRLQALISDLKISSNPLTTYTRCIKSRYSKYMKTINSSDRELNQVLQKVQSDGDINAMIQILKFLPEWINRSNYFLNQYLDLRI